MKLKRIYNRPEGWEKQHNRRKPDGTLPEPGKPEGAVLNVPPFDHVEIIHTGTSAEQNFSSGLVGAALAEGWMSIGQGKLTLHAKPEDLAYDILRSPGRYCCHCKEKLQDDATGELARAHVALAHAGKASPHASNPAGYEMVNGYECKLDPKLHKKYAAKPIGASHG